MLRRLIQIHTLILIGASLLLLIAPGAALDALGIASASFPVLALTRVIAALLAIVAAAIYPIADVASDARRPALWGVTGAYFVTTLLFLMQQTSIWEARRAPYWSSSPPVWLAPSPSPHGLSHRAGSPPPEESPQLTKRVVAAGDT